MIVGLVLAAGESKRMASPKALLQIGEDTFAGRIASILLESGIHHVSVITGAHHESIREAMKENRDVDIVYHAGYTQGQLSSLKEGLRNLPTGSTGAIIWPVDHPLVRVETVKLLMQTYESERRRLTIPVYQGKRGHPVVCDLGAIRTILGLGNDKTAKELQSIYADSISLVETDDPGVVIDIDTPEDYKTHITGVRS